MRSGPWNVSSYRRDSAWSWFICLCSTLCMIFTTGLAFALGVLFPVLMDSFNESRERTAWVSSIIFCAGPGSGPFASAFLNRFGFRIATVVGCFLCAVALLSGSFVSNNIVELYLAFSLLFALGIAPVFVTATEVATHYFDKRRSIALGFLTGGQGMGTMILGPVLQAMVKSLGWRGSFQVLAGCLFALSLTGLLLHKGTSATVSEREEASAGEFRFNFHVLKKRQVLIRIVTAFLFTFSRMVPYVHLGKHCQDLGIPDTKSSILYLVLGIFATLGRVGGGFLCNRTGLCNMTGLCNRTCLCSETNKVLLLFQVATLTMGASTMVMTLAKSYPLLVAYAIVFGMSDGMMIATFIIELLESVPDKSKKASVFGFSLFFWGIGGLSGPPLSGLMADNTGNYIGAFLMAGGVGIISFLLSLSLHSHCLRQETNLARNGNEGNEDRGEVNEDEVQPVYSRTIVMESSV